jgi:hypothetical protein
MSVVFLLMKKQYLLCFCDENAKNFDSVSHFNNIIGANPVGCFMNIMHNVH